MKVFLWFLKTLSLSAFSRADLFVHKCCPAKFAYNIRTEKCEPLARENLPFGWIPAQVRKQKMKFSISVPALDEFDMEFDPCPPFLYNVERPIAIRPSTPVTLNQDENAAISVNNRSFDQWCFDATSDIETQGKQWVLLSCPCLRQNCVSRCCGSGQRLHLEDLNEKSIGFCEISNTSWNLPWPDLELSKDNIKPWFFRDFTLYEFAFKCFQKPIFKFKVARRRPKRILTFQIDSKGILRSNRYTATRWSYCLSEAEIKGKLRTVAIYCDNPIVSFDDAFIQSMLAAIGAAFTLLTLLVHVLVKDMRQGIKGLSLIAYCSCMFGAYLTMASRPLAWTSSNACTVLGVFMHYFLLSAFYWLNVRAITIYSTFRSWESMVGGNSLKARSFLFFSTYALGVPALISVFMAWAQFTSDDRLPIVWPNFDEATCWFRKPLGRALYFSLPMGIVLVFNVYLFCNTLVNIVSFKKGNAAILKSGNNSSSLPIEESLKFDMERLMLFAKLSLLMGITYISELVSYFNYIYVYYWHVSNVAMALRAVLIFAFFCCRRKVWTSITKQYPSVKIFCDSIVGFFSGIKLRCWQNRQFEPSKTESIILPGGSGSLPSSEITEMSLT